MEEGKKRYAVLVGCNYPGTPNYLDGAVIDVLKMREVLVSRFGFERTNIALLVDIDLPESYVTFMDVQESLVMNETGIFSVDMDAPAGIRTDFVIPGKPMKPTGKNIKDMLRHIVGRAKPGDVLYFHFSGHGVQIPYGDGSNRKKTAITPCDLNLITDVDFRQIVNRLPEGVSFTYLSDSCTTGGDLLDKETEQLGDPAVNIAQLPNVNHRIRMIPYATVFTHLASKSNVQSLNINVHLSAIFGNDATHWGLPESDPFGDHPVSLESGILLTACQADAISVDVHPDPSVGRLEGYGAFCNAVQEVFRKHPNTITNKELMSRTRVELGGMQYPCLYCSDGNANAPFLWQPEQEDTA